jgi:hypothetical protein
MCVIKQPGTSEAGFDEDKDPMLHSLNLVLSEAQMLG